MTTDRISIDKKSLRDAAEKANELGSVDNFMRDNIARAHFDGLATPTVVLALIDELEDAEKRIAELTQLKGI